MHEQFIETANQVAEWARENAGIQGVIIIGSQARSMLASDQWSDLDLMVFTQDPGGLMNENTWFNCFGDVVCFFDEIVPLHFTHWSWCVKRVLYADNRDVDFSVLPYPQLDEVLAVNKEILSKGWRILYEATPGELEKKICALIGGSEAQPARPPSEQAVQAVVSELLYHVIWAFKKIRRGELWTATGCINVHMRGLLMRLIEAHSAATKQQADFLGYSGRFLEQHTDPNVLEKLAGCFTRYDAEDAVETLHRQLEFTREVSKEVCERMGWSFDAGQFEKIQELYEMMKGELRFQ